MSKKEIEIYVDKNNRVSFHDFIEMKIKYDTEYQKKDKEIERLNNVISELEEEYINYMDKQDFAKKCKISRPYLDKLLKVMNRKEIYEFCKQRNKIKRTKRK